MVVLLENVPLANFSTFGIGGPALYFTTVKTEEEMAAAIFEAKRKNLPSFILGKGSNCLFDDKGFQGLVIQNKIDYFQEKEAGQFLMGAGYSFSLAGVQTARRSWTGLEFASGIPASVGGAIYMNAGANGYSVFDTLEAVAYIDEAGEIRTYRKSELEYGYRYTSFQKMKGAILSGLFRLIPQETAREKQLQIIHYRTKTQPYGEKSAGCVFRNPEGAYAGQLIEQCGLKGIQVNDAMVSPLHANFIVNKEQAKAKDVLELIQVIQNRVREKTGIMLETEIRYISSEE